MLVDVSRLSPTRVTKAEHMQSWGESWSSRNVVMLTVGLGSVGVSVVYLVLL